MKYIGDGSALPGVPARDLTDEEAEEAIALHGEKAVAKLYEQEEEREDS